MSEPTNNNRASWANTALSAFINETGDPGDEPVSEQKPPLAITVRDISTISEYGLTQKLSSAIRCF